MHTTSLIAHRTAVASLGAEEQRAKRYEDTLDEARDAGVRKSARIGFANGLMFSSGNILCAGGFIYANWKMAEVDSAAAAVSPTIPSLFHLSASYCVNSQELRRTSSSYVNPLTNASIILNCQSGAFLPDLHTSSCAFKGSSNSSHHISPC